MDRGGRRAVTISGLIWKAELAGDADGLDVGVREASVKEVSESCVQAPGRIVSIKCHWKT